MGGTVVASATILDRYVSGDATTHHVMGPAYFDSILDTSGIGPTKNARLTIILKIALCPIGPGTEMDDAIWKKGAVNGIVKDQWTDKWVPCIAWDDASYNHFGNEVKRQAESFWSSTDTTWGNKGMTLINIKKDWDGLNVPMGIKATHQANVECDFRIEWSRNTSDAHVAVYAARLPMSANTICSWMSPGSRKKPGRGFLSTTSLTPANFGMCSGRLASGACTPATTNAVVAHEMGHAIGLPHIGVMHSGSTCSREIEGGKMDRFLRAIGVKGYDANIKSCYTGDSPADSANVMGQGSTISIENSDPWRIRIAQHTHTRVADWAAVADRWEPIELARFQKL